jgi:uncharacterized membrane protein
MAEQTTYKTTRQGVRDLDNPIRRTRQPNVGPGERALSMAVGGVLVGYGLGRGGVAGLLMAALSTGLICRGASGHCAVYEAAGINTAK